jgi:hypothetical protein
MSWSAFWPSSPQIPIPVKLRYQQWYWYRITSSQSTGQEHKIPDQRSAFTMAISTQHNPLSHPLYVGLVALNPDSPIVNVVPHLPAKYRDSDPSSIVPFMPALDTTTQSGPSSAAPYIDSYIDANLPGGIFAKIPFIGFAISMSGTCSSLIVTKLTLLQRIQLKPKWILPIN